MRNRWAPLRVFGAWPTTPQSDIVEVEQVVVVPRKWRSRQMADWPVFSRFDADAVIHSRPESLLAAEVLFCGLNADVTEQKLNLFQFAARHVTYAGACTPKVMGRNLAEIESGRKFPDHVPDHFLSNPGAPYCSVFGHAAE